MPCSSVNERPNRIAIRSTSPPANVHCCLLPPRRSAGRERPGERCRTAVQVCVVGSAPRGRTERECRLPRARPRHERRNAGWWFVVHVRPLVVGDGPGEPLEPLAFQRQLRLVEVERKVLEQLERPLVRDLELGFADELHLPGCLERPIEQPAAPIPSEVGGDRGADLYDGTI